MRRPSFYVWLGAVTPFVSLALALALGWLLYEAFGPPFTRTVVLLTLAPLFLLALTGLLARRADRASAAR